MSVRKEAPNLHTILLTRESIKGWLGTHNHTQSEFTHMSALKQSFRYKLRYIMDWLEMNSGLHINRFKTYLELTILVTNYLGGPL